MRRTGHELLSVHPLPRTAIATEVRPDALCLTGCQRYAPVESAATLRAVPRRRGSPRCMLRQGADREADLELVRGVLRRNAASVEAFVERMRCIPLMLAARNARLGYPLKAEEVQDLAQETLVAIWRRLPAYEGLARLESWIYPFCSFLLLNELRSRRRHPRSNELRGAVEPAGDVALASGDEYLQLHEALDRIEPEEGAVVRLKHFEGITFEEISARLGISSNTAKSRYYRALRRLKSMLSKFHREEGE